jgi:hypothetical protein
LPLERVVAVSLIFIRDDRCVKFDFGGNMMHILVVGIFNPVSLKARPTFVFIF